MILTFFGHADYVESSADEAELLSRFEMLIGDTPAEFYLGGYGAFDRFALRCVLLYRKAHKNAVSVLVTPYLDGLQVSRYEDGANSYDRILYPGLETVPKRFAIPRRNEWMVDEADFVFAYVKRRFGGAYHAFSYALRKGKPIFNLFPDFHP